MMEDQENRGEKELIELPSVAEIERKTALYFLNTHISSDFGRAFPPFVVPVSFMFLFLFFYQMIKSSRLTSEMAVF